MDLYRKNLFCCGYTCVLDSNEVWVSTVKTRIFGWATKRPRPRSKCNRDPVQNRTLTRGVATDNDSRPRIKIHPK
jgi:hypothetical protein